MVTSWFKEGWLTVGLDRSLTMMIRPYPATTIRSRLMKIKHINCLLGDVSSGGYLQVTKYNGNLKVRRRLVQGMQVKRRLRPDGPRNTTKGLFRRKI